MKIELDGQKMLLAHFNIRAEVHGDEREPAADLKLEADVGAEFLDKLSPALRPMLFCKDPEAAADLADQGAEAPNLRFPQLVAPLRWEDEMLGALVSIKVGNRKIDLGAASVNKLTFSPREGGTVSLELRVQCKPDEEQAGRLYSVLQTEVRVTIKEGEPQPAAPTDET